MGGVAHWGEWTNRDCIDPASLGNEDNASRRALSFGGRGFPAALIHMLNTDAPGRAADVQRRHGAVVREGNPNPEAKAFQLVTEGSFDALMRQPLERKARLIGQIPTGRLDRREAGDISRPPGLPAK